MIRFAPFLAAAAIVLLFERTSFAVGAILLVPGDTVKVVDVRYALAMSLAQTTRWASLQVEQFPGAMVWVLPVRPGARVEEVGDAWLDALEIVTAPRIVSPPCGDGGASPPKVVTESRPPLGPSVRSLRSAVLDDVPALHAFAQRWGFDLPPEREARFEEVTQRGFVFFALVYGGPAQGSATRTVRIEDDAFPLVPLFLTAAAADPVPVTTFVVADARTRLGPGREIEIDGTRISVTNDGATNYAAELRATLISAHGASFTVEAASHDVLFDGVGGPPGIEASPALAPTYFRLAAGDDHTDASDLTVALSGLDPAGAWLTRLSGLVPSHTFGDDLALTRHDGQKKSHFVVAAGSPPSCPIPDGGRVGPGGGPGGPIPPTPPLPPLPPYPPGTPAPPVTPRGRSPQTSVGMSCSCSPGPGAPEPTRGDESCDGSDPGNAGDSGQACDGSADDTSDESCDGSADDSYDSSDDGCDGSSSDTGPDDSCSSGSPDGNDGSESNESCNGGSNDGPDSCSTAPRARALSSIRMRRHRGGRPRTSAMTIALAAVALVVRRTTKRARFSDGLGPGRVSDSANSRRSLGDRR